MFSNKNYILTIAKEGSFSKAAKRLYVSQPSLSATVKRIEEKVSVPLFDRSTTPISLTEAGEEYVRYALEIEEKERDFSRYVSDYTKSFKGSIRIGGSSLFAAFMIPFMISNFNREYPNVRFEITEDTTKNLTEKLALGTLDIILDNAIIKDDNIDSTVCTSEMLLLAVPRSFEINEKIRDFRLTAIDIKAGKHRLSDQPGVNLSVFKDLPFVLLHRENDTGKRARTLFQKHNLAPNIVFYLDQQVTSYNVACTGMGVAFVSDTLVTHVDFSTSLYYYKLADTEATRDIFFYKKTNHYLSKACQKFIDSSIKKIVTLPIANLK